MDKFDQYKWNHQEKKEQFSKWETILNSDQAALKKANDIVVEL